MDKKEQELYDRVRSTLREWETARLKCEGVKRQFVAAFGPVTGRPPLLPSRVVDDAAMEGISALEQEERQAFQSHQAAIKALKEYQSQ